MQSSESGDSLDMNKLIPDPKLVATKFGVKAEQVTHYRVFQHVFLVKIQGLGCRFVSFKMAYKSVPLPKLKSCASELSVKKIFENRLNQAIGELANAASNDINAPNGDLSYFYLSGSKSSHLKN